MRSNSGPTGPFANDPEPPPTGESGTGPKADGTLGSKVNPPANSDPTGGDVPDPNPGPKADGSLEEKVTLRPGAEVTPPCCARPSKSSS